MISGGQSNEADMVFEIPMDVHAVTFRWEPDGMEDISNFWWDIDI